MYASIFLNLARMEFESKYKDAQKQIKLLEARLHELHLQLAASNSEKDKLHATINKHNEKIDSLLFNSKKLERDYASLTERYDSLEKIYEQTKLNTGFLSAPSSCRLGLFRSSPDGEPISSGEQGYICPARYDSIIGEVPLSSV